MAHVATPSVMPFSSQNVPLAIRRTYMQAALFDRRTSETWLTGRTRLSIAIHVLVPDLSFYKICIRRPCQP